MKYLFKLLLALAVTTSVAMADDYVIDKRGMHASVQFKISHLGYSWLWGRFNDFNGHFSYDKNNPNASSIMVTVNTGSVDSNHAERDKHLRGKDFLHSSKFPQAKFVSSSYTQNSDGSGELKGKLTLHGVTRPITIQIKHLGEGKDPWGGYRAGFEGITRIAMADFGITRNLGPASRELDLIFSIEGVKKK